jgi:hypothetical protein
MNNARDSMGIEVIFKFRKEALLLCDWAWKLSSVFEGGKWRAAGLLKSVWVEDRKCWMFSKESWKVWIKSMNLSVKKAFWLNSFSKLLTEHDEIWSLCVDRAVWYEINLQSRSCNLIKRWDSIFERECSRMLPQFPLNFPMKFPNNLQSFIVRYNCHTTLFFLLPFESQKTFTTSQRNHQRTSSQMKNQCKVAEKKLFSSPRFSTESKTFSTHFPLSWRRR